ncbi:DsbA family protein [Halobaculum gomorrense]|uniref:Thioredoxin n=1 Tax=Halobaculum gomorrense TaxID=43928 RepID=A0A1M5KJL8_9EURY|nr:thioredoxin domain-containing protein [Halobaculum gomorrense]SHG52915.1 Thioredoxin [Halobaculum gomorrense]
MNVTRRAALSTLGAAGLGALAGCTGGAGSSGNGGSGGSGTGTPIAEHPAAAGLADQPSLGSVDAGATVIAFEDPSCPTCRNFERDAGARLKSGPVADGDLRFVSRVYPIVYPWGDPATQALEAVYARDDGTEAYWDLFDYYFGAQGQLNGDNVLDRTESFLSSNTDLDAAGVVADAEAKAYDDAVQADLDAGEAAGANRTPTLFLYRDGAYVTRASGSVSYETVASALQL